MLESRRTTIALLALAFVFRLALAYPTHRYPADADCSLSALCAIDVLEGRPPVFFPSGVRLGAPTCYLTAGLFGALGISRAAQAFGPVLVGWATVLQHRGPTSGRAVAFGLAVGFGVWVSLQTLTCSLPAIAWLAFEGRAEPGWRSPRPWALGLAGAIAGGAPWIAFNTIHPLATFRSNFAARPVHGLGALWSNALYLVRYQIPEMFASLGSPEFTGLPPAIVARLGPVVLALYVAAALWACLGPRSGTDAATRTGDRAAGRLLLAVAATVVAFDVVSEAATYGGPTVRYILPLYLLAPGVVALAAPKVTTRWRPLAAIAATFVLAYALAGSRLPGTRWRATREAAQQREDDLVAALRGASVEAVVGPYWTVYSLNFDGYPDLRAVPLEALADAEAVEQELGARPLRWAVVEASPPELEHRLATAGLAGRALPVEGVGAALIEGRHAAASIVGRARQGGTGRP